MIQRHEMRSRALSIGRLIGHKAQVVHDTRCPYGTPDTRMGHGGRGCPSVCLRVSHLEHVLLQDEVLPPELRNVLLDSAAWWAKVPEARHTPIDLEGRYCEQLPLHDASL